MAAAKQPAVFCCGLLLVDNGCGLLFIGCSCLLLFVVNSLLVIVCWLSFCVICVVACVVLFDCLVDCPPCIQSHYASSCV